MSPAPEVRIGERLRFYRQARGKTQAVVAGLAGVTEDYLSQIERGLKTPTIALLHRFSRILAVRISELLGESAAEHSEAAVPAGNAVQRALIAYQGERGRCDLGGRPEDSAAETTARRLAPTGRGKQPGGNSRYATANCHYRSVLGAWATPA
jgi:transcriptional regulator with XRE-family HTH domain